MVSRVCRICFCLLVAVVSGSGAAQRRFPSVENGDVVSDMYGVAGSLAKSCGTSCTSLLETLFAQLNQTTAEKGGPLSFGLLKLLSGNVEQSLSRAKELAETSAGSRLATGIAGHRHMRGASRVVASENVPCATPADCAIKAMAANKCNYARIALQGTYNELNVATHVLGVLVSSLCGCVHTGHVSTCALRSLPPVCTFPYTVYSKAFAGSVQVWEAVKAATKKCIIHRDPAIAP